MDGRSLAVTIGGRRVGLLRQDERGFLVFAYDRAWIADDTAPGLSQSLPKRTEAFEERECLPFFAGLLPDSRTVRQRLAEQLGISRDNDFAFLSHLGRDCAGALVLAPSDAAPDAFEREGWVEPLSETRLAALIRELPTRPLLAREDEVMLSLAGVHDKAALFIGEDDVPCLPHKGFPSTHILKVDIKGLPDSIRTEHFCLKLARRLDIPAPHSRVEVAEGIVYMLVARYDRVVVAGAGGRTVRRLHQEDFCQARGVLPDLKYEKEGGPTLRDMFETLRTAARVPAKEVAKLVDYVIFNFLAGNPDSHAKNYSLVYRPSGVELSPIYDVNNAAAFRKHYKEQRARVAQSIGGERDPEMIGPAQWRAFAEEVHVGWRPLRRRLVELASRMPAAAHGLRDEIRASAADCAALDLLVDDVERRCGRVRSSLEGA